MIRSAGRAAVNPKSGRNGTAHRGVRPANTGIGALIATFQRTLAPMFSIGVAVAVSASSLSSAATLSAQSELLCSPEGLMRLIPQFDVNGQFTIPNPNTDLQTFLSAQQGLSNAIDMILAQENISQNPSNVGSLPSRPLIFASNWLSSEVGIQTDGKNLNSPEPGGKFGGYRVQSFLRFIGHVRAQDALIMELAINIDYSYIRDDLRSDTSSY